MQTTIPPRTHQTAKHPTRSPPGESMAAYPTRHLPWDCKWFGAGQQWHPHYSKPVGFLACAVCLWAIEDWHGNDTKGQVCDLEAAIAQLAKGVINSKIEAGREEGEAKAKASQCHNDQTQTPLDIWETGMSQSCCWQKNGKSSVKSIEAIIIIISDSGLVVDDANVVVTTHDW